MNTARVSGDRERMESRSVHLKLWVSITIHDFVNHIKKKKTPFQMISEASDRKVKEHI